VAIATLLDEPSSVELALRVAEEISEERVAGVAALDVEGGCAGAILGLAALHTAAGQDWVRDRARACGRRLIENLQPAAAGGAAWPGAEGLPLAGFAHGAAGMAYALTRLYRLTGEERFRDCARQAYLYERGIFDPVERNWPLLQSDESSGAVRRIQMKTWCHGAPGVALARVCGLQEIDDEEVREELKVGLETTRRVGFGGLDHLCCGNLGRVDVLLTAGRVLHRDGLIREAGGRAAMVLRRATAHGAFGVRLKESENRCFVPGFFRGTSGIGYLLLRVACPERLPSVLAFSDPAAGGRE
jgi:lantibiotic modifying enzyme